MWKNGTLLITDEYEDIHSFVEANLIDRIGDAGKKLHTGRSRNDQVALDMKLYTRDEILEVDVSVKRTAGSSFENDERAYGHIYAGIYPSSEGTADYAGTSSWRLL